MSKTVTIYDTDPRSLGNNISQKIWDLGEKVLEMSQHELTGVIAEVIAEYFGMERGR